MRTATQWVLVMTVFTMVRPQHMVVLFAAAAVVIIRCAGKRVLPGAAGAMVIGASLIGFWQFRANSPTGDLNLYTVFNLSFSVWLLKGFIDEIPKEYEEAALVDGANHLQMLVRIFLQVAVPGLIAATIYAFTVSWSGFLYPLAFIFSSEQQVLTAGTVTSLIKGDVYHWGGLMAGLMDYYISGLTAGSTKA